MQQLKLTFLMSTVFILENCTCHLSKCNVNCYLELVCARLKVTEAQNQMTQIINSMFMNQAEPTNLYFLLN